MHNKSNINRLEERKVVSLVLKHKQNQHIAPANYCHRLWKLLGIRPVFSANGQLFTILTVVPASLSATPPLPRPLLDTVRQPPLHLVQIAINGTERLELEAAQVRTTAIPAAALLWCLRSTRKEVLVGKIVERLVARYLVNGTR